MAPLDLKQPIKAITEQVNAMTDPQELAAAGRAERDGAHRSGVLNLIQGRIGALMTDPQTMRDALAQAGAVAPAQDGKTNTPFLQVPGNAELAGATAVIGGNVEQTRPQNVALYFMTELGIAMPRYVAFGAVRECMAAGALEYCPDCGRTNCGLGPERDRDGYPVVSGDVNACFARGAVAFGRCQICGKRVYDPGTRERPPEELLPGEVDLAGLQTTTPAQRIKARLDTHMLAFHADQARMLGLMPMPAPGQVFAGMRPAAAVAAPPAPVQAGGV